MEPLQRRWATHGLVGCALGDHLRFPLTLETRVCTVGLTP